MKTLTRTIALLTLLLASPLFAQKTPISISVTDKVTGEAIPDVEVTMQSNGPVQRAKTDDSGRTTVSVASPTPQYLTISVKKATYGGQAARWRNVTKDKPLPEELSFALEPGITIGAFVKDEAGKPVKNARVQMFGPTDEQNGVIKPNARIDVRTDENGKFTDSSVPADMERMWINVEHPEFHNDSVYHFAPPMPELKAQTATIKLQRAAQFTGKILNQDGAPVVGATIGVGEEGWGDLRYRAKTGADGSFTLKGMKPGQIAFSVTSKDYAPHVDSVPMPLTKPLEIKLKPGNPIKFHVTDSSGKAIPSADINVSKWNDKLIEFKGKTDSSGDLAWNGGPADGEIEVDVVKKTFGMIRDRKISIDSPSAQPIEFKLFPPPKVDITVTDAKTGEPIKQFKVTQGIAWGGREENINWMSDRNGGSLAPKTGRDGKATFNIEYPYPGHAVRIEAMDYLPAKSKIFKGDEGPVSLEIKLEKGESIAGVVKDAAGKPVGGAKVYILTPGKNFNVENGRVSEYAERESTHVETDADGNFKIPPQSEHILLVCMTDEAGFARLDSKPADRSSKPGPLELKLQPWAQVEGTFMIGTKPGVGTRMTASSSNQSHQQGQPNMWMSASADVDATGHFVFPRVVAGPTHLGSQVKLSENMTGSSNSHNFTAEAGKTHTVSIGGTGRPIVGRVAIAKDFNDGKFSFQGGNINGVIASTQPTTAAAGQDLSKASDDEKKKAFAAWIKGKVSAATDNNQQNRRWFSFRVEPDGKFRIEDVPAGNWQLSVQIAGPADTRRGWSPPIAFANTSFDVPAMPSGRSDEPLDIGEVPVTKSNNNNQ